MKKKKKKKLKNTLRVKQSDPHSQMHKASGKGLLAKKQRNKSKRRFEKVKDSISHNLQDLHPGTMVFYAFALLAIVAAVALNLILIHAAVVYLVKLSGAPASIQQFAAFAVPVLTVIFLLTISNQIRVTVANNDSDRGWRIISHLLMLFTPLLLCAAFYSAKDFSMGKWLLLGAQVAIILATELAIVNNGAFLHQAFGFFLYQIQAIFFKSRINHYHGIYKGQQRIAAENFNKYAVNLNDYNEKYPNAPVRSENFSIPTIYFVNEAMGYEALQVPIIKRKPREVNSYQEAVHPDEPFPPNQIPNPEKTSTPPIEMTPATATPEANDEVQNLQKELDRLRHELVARARREDGEVRP
jgi:hypothetical protein